MNNILLLFICTLAWLAWIPLALLKKKGKGDDGGISIFPVIPVFPIAAWLIGTGLNYLFIDLGLYIIGGLHILMILVFAGSSVYSGLMIRKRSSRE